MIVPEKEILLSDPLSEKASKTKPSPLSKKSNDRYMTSFFKDASALITSRVVSDIMYSHFRLRESYRYRITLRYIGFIQRFLSGIPESYTDLG
ncbi:MAG: hypothetical protein ACLPKE_02900 [Streptosporangiaceae bacterium]